MMRISALAAGSLAALALMFATAGPAAADPVSDAVSVLNSDNLYVAPNIAPLKVDQARARAALANSPIKVAVFPPTSTDPVTLAREIGQKLSDSQVTVAVFAGTKYGAGSGVLGKNCAAIALSRAVSENRTELQQTKDLTSTIVRFAELVKQAPTSGSCGTNNGGSTSSGSIDKKSSGAGGTWAVLGVLGVAGAGGIGALIWRRKRKEKRALADARALIQPYYDQLAADVGSLQPGDNAIARQALADASQRFNSGGSQLATATSLAQLGGARRSILEGLQATRTARSALGLDPGPDLPPLAESTAPQLTQAQQLNVGGQNVQGYPNYTPGAPYYFAGGGGYAGGWYSMPFWETLLIAEALSPGWGWGFGGYGWGGGGYGAGYESGYDSGRESAEQDSNSGDWGGGGGGGGGGDWGGGGGDWGGGGDSGGGGGDW
jgi:hypothetical protein